MKSSESAWTARENRSEPSVVGNGCAFNEIEGGTNGW